MARPAASRLGPARPDPGHRAGPGSSRPSPPSAPAWCSPSCCRSPPTARRCTSATTSGCSGSTSRLASLLVSVIVVAAVRLLWRVARGRFGSRLLLKLAAIFALVGVVPGRADLHRELPVRLALDRELVRRQGRGRARRRPQPRPRHDRLDRHRPRRPRRGWPPSAWARAPARPSRSRSSACASSSRPRRSAIVGSAGQSLIATGSTPLRADARAAAAAAAAPGEDAARGEPGRGAGRGRRPRPARRARVRAVALIPSSTFALGAQERYLVVTQALSPTLAANALAVTNAYREYQQRALARERPAQDVHRHADADPGARRVRRAAARHRPQQPAGAAAAAAGRGRATRWRTATSARRRSSPRATSSAA